MGEFITNKHESTFLTSSVELFLFLFIFEVALDFHEFFKDGRD